MYRGGRLYGITVVRRHTEKGAHYHNLGGAPDRAAR